MYAYIHINIAREDLFDMVISLTMDAVILNVPGTTLDKINIIIEVYGSSPFVRKHWRSLYCLLIILF
jgi:hypothetical protein